MHKKLLERRGVGRRRGRVSGSLTGFETVAAYADVHTIHSMNVRVCRDVSNPVKRFSETCVLHYQRRGVGCGRGCVSGSLTGFETVAAYADVHTMDGRTRRHDSVTWPYLVLLYSVAQRDHWVHPINNKRRMFGEYHHLMHDLEADDDKFPIVTRQRTSAKNRSSRIIPADGGRRDERCATSVMSVWTDATPRQCDMALTQQHCKPTKDRAAPHGDGGVCWGDG
ncbi:hypothetical protein J6590_055390 [Homalodisca vitripennis]|nr:hypothetical protein J6590_055390 [Homalodisca vitripennis]